jgi:opacity protein-like surface antigen
MKTARLPALIIFLISSAAPVAAQEHFYDNGFYVGLGAQASIMSRDQKINYGFPAFCGPTPFCGNLAKPFSGTALSDVAPSPVMTLGYKFNENNSISLTGDWARYSVKRVLVATGATGFITIAVDGANGTFVPPGSPDPGPTSVDIDWNSDVYNAALEYQRRLTSGQLGGILGLLGFKLRSETQSFDAKAVNPTVIPSPVVDNYREKLTEFLFGPYGGLKLSFKPQADSKLNFNFKGTVGYYFKNASLDAHDKFFNGQHFSQHDHAQAGTLFAGAGVNIVYALTKNWFLDASYEFNWIRSASNIWNTDHTPADASAATPSRIAGSAIITHTPGLKVIYKFD